MKKSITKFFFIMFTFVLIFMTAVFSFFSWILKEYSESNWDCL